MKIQNIFRQLVRKSNTTQVPLTLEDRLDKVLQPEADLIESIFRQRGLVGVTIPEITTSSIAGYVRFHVNRPYHVEVSKITKLRGDIAATLTAHRPHDDDVTVHINPVQMVIEVEYPFDRLPLEWSIVPTHSLRPMDILIGRCYEGKNAQPIKINLNDKTVSNIGVFALPGSGKTQAITQMVATGAYSTSPEDIKFVVLDPKFSPELEALSAMAHVEWVTEPADCQQMVFNIKAELDRRKRNRDNRKIVLVIDELAEFFRENDIDDTAICLRSIASLGRQLNVHLIVATQYPTVKATDSELRNMIDMRLGGHVGDEVQSKVAMGLSGVGCENLPSPGAFLFKDQKSKIKRINTHFLPEEDIPHWAERVNHRWRSAESWEIPKADAPVPEAISTKSDAVTSEQINLILDNFDIDEILTDDGEFKRGMGAKLIRLAFGDNVQARGGKYMRWKTNMLQALINDL
jgi:hypothetical protein